MKNKDLITVEDLTLDEINKILNYAAKLKKRPKKRKDLEGKTLGLVFQKPSNRTRVSFSVGMYQLGGNTIYLAPEELQLGKRESIKDVARVLSKYIDIIAARTYSHDDLVEFAHESDVPVINALTDLLHPAQALSDIFTIKELKKHFKDVKLSYIGDGNNVLHSLMLTASRVGLNMHIATPKGYEPNNNIVKKAQDEAKLHKSEVVLGNDPVEAVKDADFIYTDVWTSMHQKDEFDKRKEIFSAYQINKQLLAKAKKDYYIMHCLPAQRGFEITDEVMDAPQSICYEQAENRLHVQKAILLLLLKNK